MAAVFAFHLLVLVQKEDLASDLEDLQEEILEKNLFVLELDFEVLDNLATDLAELKDNLAKDLAELKDNLEKEIVDKEDNWDN